MNQSLSRRSYATQEEMSRDWWTIYYQTEQQRALCPSRLTQRAIADGPDSLARRLWDNAYWMRNTNSGADWLPDHPTVKRKLFVKDREPMRTLPINGRRD